MFKALRHALRLLWHSPAFTVISVASLALGIGATSAMFSFSDALLLRPLPVYEPSRVAAVTMVGSTAFGSNTALSYPDYRDYRDANHTLSGIVAAGYSSFGFSPDAQTPPKFAFGCFVSGNLFDVLGVRPERGRSFSPSEDAAQDRDPVVVLGHDFWASRLDANPGAVGSKIRLNGVEFTIIGIAPKSFTSLDGFVKPTVFVPMAMAPALAGKDFVEKRDFRWLTVKGRLKPGVSAAQASLDLAAIGNRLEQLYPKTNRGEHVAVTSELSMRIKQNPPSAALAAMLLLLSLCVLLVACANVTGLLLSRSRARAREIAVRLAIGASRGALIRQLLLENLIVALAGGLAGIAVAYGGVRFLNDLPIPTDIPVAFQVSIDMRMLLFTVGASLLSTLLFGFTPALQTTRLDLVSALKSADADSGGKQRLWGRNLIVMGQVALTLVLLIVSAVLLTGFHEELAQGPGFRTDHLFLTSYDTAPLRYPKEKTVEFYKHLLEKMRQAPGVKSAALTTNVPFFGGDTLDLVPEGFQLPRGQKSLTAFNFYVSDGYFDTFGIPIVQGRGILPSDQANTPKVAVVNEQFARHFWPKQNPIGKRFHIADATGPIVEVVGVAKMSKYFWIAEPPLDFAYLPYTQTERSGLSLVAESSAEDAATLAPVVRQVIRNIDPNTPSFDARTMKNYYDQRAVKTPNMLAQSVAGLGCMGLVLSVVGLYGLISYSVSRRTREIGIRMAIGSNRSQVLQMVLRQGLRLSILGIVAGLVISFFVCQILISSLWIATFSHLNYGLFAAVAIPLLLVSVVATLAPARRASLIDPMRALREE